MVRKPKEYGTEEFHPIEVELNVPYKDDAIDYHFMCNKSSSKEFCDKNNIGEIYTNAAKCSRCSDYVRSKNKHDYRSCSCGGLSVDGGSHYLKRSYTVPYKDMSISFDWAMNPLDKASG